MTLLGTIVHPSVKPGVPSPLPPPPPPQPPSVLSSRFFAEAHRALAALAAADPGTSTVSSFNGLVWAGGEAVPWVRRRRLTLSNTR